MLNIILSGKLSNLFNEYKLFNQKRTVLHNKVHYDSDIDLCEFYINNNEIFISLYIDLSLSGYLSIQ